MTPYNSSSASRPSEFEALWKHGPGAVFRLLADFRFAWLSDSVAALTGRSAHDWIEHPAAIEHSVHPQDWQRFAAHRQSLGSQPQGGNVRFRLLHAKTGAVMWLREFCVPCCGDNQAAAGYEGIWLDDSSAARLDKHTAASAWTEALAAMSSGLTHDFNNVLTGVLSLSEHLLTQLPPGHPFREGLTLMNSNGREASRWIQRFSQMHQARPGMTTWHDVNELVADAAQLLRHLLSRRYGLEVRPTSQAEPLMIDAVSFQRTLLMLIFRAVALMPRPATLQICVEHEPNGSNQAEWVRVGVEVNGEPTPIVREDQGEAALAAARQFAERHGGRLEFEPNAATGTTTWLILPGAAAGCSKPQSAEHGVNGRRWLLLGGGNAGQSEAWADWLRTQSFLVSLDDSGTAALNDDDYQFDAAVVLPEVGAEAAALQFLKRIRDARRDLPVLAVLPQGLPFETEVQLSRVASVVSAGEAQRERLAAKLAAALNRQQCG